MVVNGKECEAEKEDGKKTEKNEWEKRERRRKGISGNR